MFDPIGDDSQCQSFSLLSRFMLAYAIGEHPWKDRHLANPTPIMFSFDFHSHYSSFAVVEHNPPELDGKELSLLMPQCFDRIEAGGAPRGEVAERHADAGGESDRQGNDFRPQYER